MSNNIRPFTTDDYGPVTAVRNAVHPEYPGTPEELRLEDERRDPKCRSSNLTRPGQSICPTTGCSVKYPASLWIPTTMYG